jgi:ADP-heptose:LPS heptosyltransferase
MKILVIRRDNIGDLVLTTPVFVALRRRFPDASIEALVNSYNAPVLDAHPDIDRVHVYTKTKHRETRIGIFPEIAERLRQWLALRDRRFDHVMIASPGFRPRQLRFARLLNPRHLSSFVAPGMRPRGVDFAIDFPGPQGHHVEDTFRILGALDIRGAPPAPRIAIHAAAKTGVVGVHVSARRPRSRWPEARYVQFMRRLHERTGARFMLFWAPGNEHDPRHPGDDAKALRILDQVRSLPVEPVDTRTLQDLPRGLSVCDAVVCSDGGAMHLAAALGKPIVCFFGDSPAWHWHPWGVPYRLLQPPSLDAGDITVEEALAAFDELALETRARAA